ncbi:MAG: ABC transporter substrate-binding protein, partial [Chloroflexi bacterium]|nr:ABC transporter substrate-binding protein [Chloroflexota bacterium]
DVVRSWLRLLDPERPSPLASLMLDVRGAFEHVSGSNPDPASVGIRAAGDDVIVELERPGSDFPAIVSGPSFAVVAPNIDDADAFEPESFVGSGGYTLESVALDEIVLTANSRYWAGPPAIPTIRLLNDIGGRSPVAAFEAGDVDYIGISAFDAAWIAYDETLGPQLRAVPALSSTYLGFAAAKPPFDDVLVRRAFGAAVDWARIGELGSGLTSQPLTSMVPPGIRGAPAGSWLPEHDPKLARDLLAEAGYPGGAGFPEVTFATLGTPLAGAIAAELERELDVSIRLEGLDDHFGRIAVDPPHLFTVGWIADYPGPNDFLGVLLRTGSSNNYGRWSSAAFDAAVDEALGSADPATIEAGWRRALEIVRDDVPAVPLLTGDGWALSRDGLLGAGQNGLGLLRMAGLAWDLD